jgi:hypothetical protein
MNDIEKRSKILKNVSFLTVNQTLQIGIDILLLCSPSRSQNLRDTKLNKIYKYLISKYSDKNKKIKHNFLVKRILYEH